MIRTRLFTHILYTCVSAFMLLPLPGYGQRELSLSEAIQQGLENNYRIRLAAADLAVAENNNDYALTNKYPTISLGLNPTVNYRDNTNPASIVSQSNTTSYGVGPTVNLDWTLFNGGRVEIAKEQLSTLADLSAGQLQVRVEATVADIIQSYYSAVVQQKQIDVLQRILTLSRDQIKYQGIRREFGRAGTFDELQARDAYLSDSSQLVQQNINYRVAIHNLLQVIGATDLEQKPVLTTELRYTNELFNRPALIQRLEANNSQLQSLAINRELAGIRTKLIETEYLPRVSLNAGSSYNVTVQTGTQTFDFGGGQASEEQELPGVAARTLNGSLGIGVNYLLYDGKNRRVRQQSAELEEASAALEIAATSQELRTQLLNAISRHENQQELVRISESLIENAERNITVAEERFKGGTINSFEYRIVQLNLINAEFQRLNALLTLKGLETEVLRLTGQVVE